MMNRWLIGTLAIYPPILSAGVVEYVAHNPGAIGYIGKGTPHEGVKILQVR
jgi:hypothetical protein